MKALWNKLLNLLRAIRALWRSGKAMRIANRIHSLANLLDTEPHNRSLLLEYRRLHVQILDLTQSIATDFPPDGEPYPDEVKESILHAISVADQRLKECDLLDKELYEL